MSEQRIIHLEKRVTALEKQLAHYAPHIDRTIPLGPSAAHREKMDEEQRDAMTKIFTEASERLKAKEAPPVDRNAQQLVSGNPVPEGRDHTKLKPNGQQEDYVVLTPEERAKGFVRPVRRAYIHVGVDPVMQGAVLITPGTSKGGKACGSRTTMSTAIAETYARDPYFYSGTFCCACQNHFDLEEFYWDGTAEQVGS